ncbi:MAG: glycosyltransferase family 2 protein [Microgenomates group bacterium]
MISVIIPTYKNTELFLKNLVNNLKYLNNYQIIIVNDDPSKSIKKEIKNLISRQKIKSDIVLIENKKNLGFGQSVNSAIKKAKGKYLLLLNSDVVLKNKNYLLALNCFKNDPKVFAVSFAQIEKDGSIVGKNKIFWYKGLYHHQKSGDLKFGENGWAEGGASIFDKEKFIKLGGFDPLFSPFYWEDVDLSFRAKKLGYKILFNPKVKVLHQHESTIGKYFNKDQIEKIAFRNQLIFTWKNIDNFKKLIEHVLYLPLNINFKKNYLLGFFEAIKILLNKKKQSNVI